MQAILLISCSPLSLQQPFQYGWREGASGLTELGFGAGLTVEKSVKTMLHAAELALSPDLKDVHVLLIDQEGARPPGSPNQHASPRCFV